MLLFSSKEDQLTQGANGYPARRFGDKKVTLYQPGSSGGKARGGV